MSGAFQLKQSSQGGFFFTLAASNGEVLLSSQIFKNEQEAAAAIDQVKLQARDTDNFRIRTLSNGQCLFVLLDTSGRIIGSSQIYKSIKAAQDGIEAVKHSASKSTKSTRNTQSIEAIGSVRTFLTAIANFEPELDSKIFYRGHGKSTYKLVPSVYRNEGWIKNENIMFYELLLRCPGDFNASGSTFNALVKMQHYSLPTRLLDITANPLIALYFACEDGETQDAEVVVFRIPKNEIKYHDSDTVSVISNISRMPKEFSIPVSKLRNTNDNPEVVRLVREIQREKPYFEKRIHLSHINSVICVKPVLDNPRIIKQDGAFLLFGMGRNKLEPAKVPTSYLASTAELRMIIRGTEKRKILQQLELLGITRQSIYPEIDHVSGYIRNTYAEY